MATKQDLRDSFRQQGDAMSGCCSNGASPAAPACLGLRGRRAQIAARVPAWNALPGGSHSFDPVIDALGASAAQLDAAGSDEECRAAIEAAHGPLDLLDQLLDATGS